MEHICGSFPESKSAGRSRLENGDIAELLVGFDPEKFPILAQHWRGLEPWAQAGDVALRVIKRIPHESDV